MATQLVELKSDKAVTYQIKINSALKRCSDLLDNLSHNSEANALDSFNGFDQNHPASLRHITAKLHFSARFWPRNHTGTLGQMTQPELGYLQDLADIEKYFLGSVFSGGNSDPREDNSLKAWADAYDRCQQHARNTRLGIPILYGIDAVHGHNNVLGAVIFPHHIGLGCTRNAGLVEKIARLAALEISATGINWTFAPYITVPRDERWGRTYEGFSEDPQLVSLLGEAAVRGFQGSNLNDPLFAYGYGLSY